jgi:hypothetical protein
MPAPWQPPSASGGQPFGLGPLRDVVQIDCLSGQLDEPLSDGTLQISACNSCYERVRFQVLARFVSGGSCVRYW